MKKIFSFLLITAMMLVTGAYAADLGIYSPASRVAVTGTLGEELAGESISLLLVKAGTDADNISGDDIGYIDQTVADADGSYSFKFKFNGFEFDESGNVSNYTISLKHGDDDVTTTVKQSSAVTSDLVKADISLTPKASTVTASASIDNLYKLGNLPYNIILAAYNDNDELVDVKIKSGVAGTDKTADEVSYTLDNSTSYVKSYVWDNFTSLIPLTGTVSYKKGSIDSCRVTYPTYTTKAFTVNIDDGFIANDQYLVDLFKEKGVHAAFNLIGYNASNCPSYEGFEIANHTTHVKLFTTDTTSADYCTYEQCIYSIEQAEKDLSAYVGEENITGLVWPYYTPSERPDYEQLLDYARQNGYLYARGVDTTGNFDLPADWMKWNCTATTAYGDPLPFAKKFADQEETDNFRLYSLWGHSTDLSQDKMLAIYNTLIELLINDEIWNPTPSEFVKYVQAAEKLDITETYVHNPTDVAIYAVINGARTIIEPHSYADVQ